MQQNDSLADGYCFQQVKARPSSSGRTCQHTALQGSGNTRAKAVSSPRWQWNTQEQRRCLRRDGSGTHRAKAVSSPRWQWNTQGKGGVFAAEAVESQSKGSAVTCQHTALPAKNAAFPPPASQASSVSRIPPDQSEDDATTGVNMC